MSTSSSELSGSLKLPGRSPAKSPDKPSNFSHTCSLLSQYLREKGTLGDLSLGINEAAGAPEMFRRAMNPANFVPPLPRQVKSMDLFPQQAGFGPAKEGGDAKFADSGEGKSATKDPAETAQMTIFYGGQVIVFNDFPADKAKEVMLLASNSMAGNQTEQGCLIPPFYGANNMIHDCIRQLPDPIVSGLPIARRNSLHRFLEKRKDRITARAPYNPSGLSATPGFKRDAEPEIKSWLSLAAQTH